MRSAFTLLMSLSPAVLGCADHLSMRQPNEKHGHYRSRDLDRRVDAPTNWTYAQSYDWHTLSPQYEKCQTGTQQSPIHLPLDQGLSSTHFPTFVFPGLSNYTAAANDSNSNSPPRTVVEGEYLNWGYGPAFNVRQNSSSVPTIAFDNVTATMAGWHVHAPADHSVGGDRSKAELHIVWTDRESGRYVAVTAIRLDPGRSNSTFWAQFQDVPMIRWDDRDTQVPINVDFGILLGDADRNLDSYFNEFWTYEGSLTSPPCTENIRWFVARNIHWMNVEQMQTLLGISRFSARPEQEVWLHRVNA